MYRYSISHTDLNEEGKTKSQSSDKTINVKPTVVVCLTIAQGETRDAQSFFDLEHAKCSASAKNLVILLGTSTVLIPLCSRNN